MQHLFLSCAVDGMQAAISSDIAIGIKEGFNTHGCGMQFRRYGSIT
jgi:hypothetical protein